MSLGIRSVGDARVGGSQSACDLSIGANMSDISMMTASADSGAGCGIRTHTSLRTMVFETIAYPSSANPAGDRPNYRTAGRRSRPASLTG